MKILAIETSCDDTSVAIVDGTGLVCAMLSANQDEFHRPFGGVVPEVASRRHTEDLIPLIEQTLAKGNLIWSDITGISVTSRPGLLGSLLVGVVTAKTLSLVHNIPFVGVNHIEGHLLAPLLSDKSYAPPDEFGFPYLGLAVSGGHSHLFACDAPGKYRALGHTRDDAAGEAFDKFAKMMGLGFPGGVKVDQFAALGDATRFQFPRPLLHDDTLDFSFSGLKTSAMRMIDSLSSEEKEQSRNDLCASYQEAIVEILIVKLVRAAKKYRLTNWTITGGVSANSRLRKAAEDAAKKHNAVLALPPLRYCTDNAAMIGMAGIYKLKAGEQSSQDLGPSASSLEADWLKP